MVRGQGAKRWGKTYGTMYKQVNIGKSFGICIANFYAYGWKHVLPGIEYRHKDYKTHEIALSWWNWQVRFTFYKKFE